MPSRSVVGGADVGSTLPANVCSARGLQRRAGRSIRKGTRVCWSLWRGEVLDTLEELLKRETPDIVANILPVRLSRDAVIACAEAGAKAVSCEKPMAVELSVADEMVRVCPSATAFWLCYGLLGGSVFTGMRTVAARRAYRSADGGVHPGGLPREVSGAGCVQLTQMRLVTGMEVEWVEGWVLPPEPG